VRELSEHNAEAVSKLRRFVWRAVWETVTTALPALLIALFINVFIAEAAVVEDGPSMEPNLYRGYQMMTEKMSYHFHPPHRGDVVIVDPPGGGKSLVKRVVGLPGEVVEVRGGQAWVDGEVIEEPWVTYYGGPDHPPAVVPAGHVFILGDNRGNSHDSRAIGAVPLEAVRGRVWLVYWPPEGIRVEP